METDNSLRIILDPINNLVVLVVSNGEDELTIGFPPDEGLKIAGLIQANSTIILQHQFVEQLRVREEEAQLRQQILNTKL